jgi:hypothetical protein
MDDFDLEIENYDLREILNLFKIDYNFDSIDLKRAQRTALKMHPDKSNLPKEYFMFFRKAFQIVQQIYYYRNKKLQDSKNKEYTVDVNKENKKLLKSLDGKSVKEFNVWFNTAFEKVKVSDKNQDSGYGDWFKSDKDIHNTDGVNMNDFERLFEKRKTECKSLVVRKDIDDNEKSSGYMLERSKPQIYESNMFSKLQFDDLKKAHTQTVVPVTREDFLNKPQFGSLDSYKRHRANQQLRSMTRDEARTYLANKELNDGKMNTERAYNLLKQDEQMKSANEKWWSHLKQLKN